MAFTYSGVTYTGKEAATWYSKIVYGAPSLDLLGIMPNVKSKMQVPNLNASNIIKAQTCNFTASGDVDADTRQIEVFGIDINVEYCEEDLESWFISEQMRPGSNNTGNFTPAELNDMILKVITEKGSEETEFLIWQGDTASLDPQLSILDGLEKLLAADVLVVPVVGVALTAANIITELDKVIAAIPGQMRRLRSREKVGIAVNQTTYALIIAGLNALVFNPTLLTAVPDMLERLGWKIYAVDGMSDDTMVFADFTRMWVGTDLVSDIRDLKVIPMSETTGDSKVRIKGRYKLGVQYAVSEEIVYYA